MTGDTSSATTRQRAVTAAKRFILSKAFDSDRFGCRIEYIDAEVSYHDEFQEVGQ